MGTLRRNDLTCHITMFPSRGARGGRPTSKKKIKRRSCACVGALCVYIIVFAFAQIFRTSITCCCAFSAFLRRKRRTALNIYGFSCVPEALQETASIGVTLSMFLYVTASWERRGYSPGSSTSTYFWQNNGKRLHTIVDRLETGK